MKYLVLSYDSDQQQSFTDFVEAAFRWDAEAIVSRARDYALVVDSFSADELKTLAFKLEQAQDVPATSLALLTGLDEAPDAEGWCVECDSHDCHCGKVAEVLNELP